MPRRDGRTPRLTCALGLVLAVSAGTASASGQPGPLYRIFLKDGSTLASYGEFARVEDRVVFSMPVGARGAAPAPALTLVSIPAGEVDWGATDRYVEAVRAARYAATRGEADYAALAGRIASILDEIRATADARRRLALAVDARGALADYARTSYGYRAREVAELAAVLDEVVSELRAATGDDHFELHLVAGAVAPPSTPLLPPPTLQESIAQVLRAARLTADSTSRIDLLRAAVALLDVHRASLVETWASETRRRAAAELAAELRTERAYRSLANRLLADAHRAARRADVAGLERLVAQAMTRDAALGGRRPDAMRALVATLREKLDAARRLRLARDAWAVHLPAYRAYRDRIAGTLARAGRARAALEAIRRLDGPAPARLPRVEGDLGEAARALTRVSPPDALRSVHAMLVSALHLGRQACRLRREAVATAQMSVAWNASASAAGAIVLFDRARHALDRLLEPPALP